jgi:hypothetical protein
MFGRVPDGGVTLAVDVMQVPMPTLGHSPLSRCPRIKEVFVARIHHAAAALVGLAAAGLFAAPASAQVTASASINATANVTGIAPLTASGVNDLKFGAVTAGTPKTPSSLASDAGRWSISGEVSYPVHVSFTLPSVLTGPGASTIPISFGGSDGLLWAPYPGAHTTFNPNTTFFTTTDPTGNLTIGISGTVSPPLGTTTGTYTGTVTLTVAY